MTYENLLRQIAAKHNITPEETEKEMRKAIRAAGYTTEPELFISLVTAKVNSRKNKAKHL